jgi:hypothetical protein
MLAATEASDDAKQHEQVLMSNEFSSLPFKDHTLETLYQSMRDPPNWQIDWNWLR